MRNHKHNELGWNHRKHAFTIPQRIFEALSKMAMDRQTHISILINRLVEEGLRNDGFIK